MCWSWIGELLLQHNSCLFIMMIILCLSKFQYLNAQIIQAEYTDNDTNSNKKTAIKTDIVVCG